MRHHTLFVIGAGATHGAYQFDEDDQGPSVPSSRRRYVHPLAGGLFALDDNPVLLDMAQHHPSVRMLARRLVGTQVEPVLREWLQGSNPTLSEHAAQIPAYIRDVIATCDNLRTAGMSRPNAYSDLIRDFIVDAGHRVTFVTLNYDRQIEMALESAGYFITTMLEYMDPQCRIGRKGDVTLLKLHGSVDWAERVTWPSLAQAGAEYGSWKTRVPQIRAAMLRSSGDREVIRLDTYNTGQLCSKWVIEGRHPEFIDKLVPDMPIVPVIAAPVGERADGSFLAPLGHVEATASRLNSVTRVVLAGFSCLDTHVLRYLGQNLPKRIRELDVCNESNSSSLRALDAYRAEVPFTADLVRIWRASFWKVAPQLLSAGHRGQDFDEWGELADRRAVAIGASGRRTE